MKYKMDKGIKMDFTPELCKCWCGLNTCDYTKMINDSYNLCLSNGFTKGSISQSHVPNTILELLTYVACPAAAYNCQVSGSLDIQACINTFYLLPPLNKHFNTTNNIYIGTCSPKINIQTITLLSIPTLSAQIYNPNNNTKNTNLIPNSSYLSYPSFFLLFILI